MKRAMIRQLAEQTRMIIDGEFPACRTGGHLANKKQMINR